MIFSKSFGYAVRGVLYIAVMQDEKKYVHVEEIASSLMVPRHFMGKILKRLVKEKLIASSKGPSGGFTVNDSTLDLPLIRLVDITDGLQGFGNCVLRVKACNEANPCPLHYQVEGVKHKLKSMLYETTIGDLLKEDKKDFINSISTGFDVEPVLRD